MSQIRMPLNGPIAWVGPDMAASDAWLHQLTDAEIAELDAALEVAKASGLPMEQLSRAQFPLPTMAPMLAGWLDELETGRGFVTARGVPVERYTEADAAIVYWGMGLYLGTAVSQNAAGDVLGHVRDTGDDPNDPSVRLYRTRARQSFHVDGADIIGLLCLRISESGGESLIVSSVSIYNEIGRRRPDLVPLLFENYCWDNHQQQEEGGPAFFEVPICAFRDDQLHFAYAGWYIRGAQGLPGVPPLTPEQHELLDLIDEIAEDPAFHLSVDCRPGDIQLLRNSTILHSREAYLDHPEPERKRHLLRLWLRATDFTENEQALLGAVPEKAGVRSDAQMTQT